MATFITLPNGRTKVQIRKAGVKIFDTFATKTEAKAWATAREAEILAGRRGEVPNKTFGELIQRYMDEVSPIKKGAKWEIVRLRAILREPIAAVKVKDLDGTHVSRWRDRRLAGNHDSDKYVAPVCGSTVQREWNLLSAVCSRAISEWKWLRVNPFSKVSGVRRPQGSRARDVIFKPQEIEMLRAYVAENPTVPNVRVFRVLEFAIETAMRSSEIIFLGEQPEHMDLTARVAHLPDTKNGRARDVPLTSRAIALWKEALCDYSPRTNVWGLTDATRDTHWRELRDACSKDLAHLHFHDARHTAITRLAKRLQILDLARMTGHTDLKQLMTYYNESAADIAQKLNDDEPETEPA